MDNDEQEDFLAGSDSESESEPGPETPEESSLDQGNWTTEASSSEDEQPGEEQRTKSNLFKPPYQMTDEELRQKGIVRLPLLTKLQGKEIDSIVGPSKHYHTIIWMVKFKGKEKCNLIHGTLFNRYFPAHVIQYYEKRIKRLPGSKKYKTSYLKNFIVDLSECPSVQMFKASKQRQNKRLQIQYI